MKSEPVTVIIPAYNEEKAVGEVVQEVRKTLQRAEVPHEILVVDDGSRDQTAARAEKAGARVVSMGENRGYGASIKAGMRESQYNLIAILDADGTYPAGELPELLRLVETADMAVGARAEAGGGHPLLEALPKVAPGKMGQLPGGPENPGFEFGPAGLQKEHNGPLRGAVPERFFLHHDHHPGHGMPRIYRQIPAYCLCPAHRGIQNPAFPRHL